MAEKKYYGIYQGIVTNIEDPEMRGRIKVKCPDVLSDTTESAWCDPLVPVAYDGGGDFCIPSLEETVWIQFIAGDANRPVYMGGWWSVGTTPLGENYIDIDTIRIINYSDCTITMREGKIDINVGEGEYKVRVENNKVDVSVGDKDYILRVQGNKVSVKGDLVVDGNITSEGTVKAKSVNADTVTADGVSLSDHTHSISPESSTTDTPS